MGLLLAEGLAAEAWDLQTKQRSFLYQGTMNKKHVYFVLCFTLGL